MSEIDNRMLSHIESWKKSLLDISLRNQAINFRRKKTSTIQIIFPKEKYFLDNLINIKNITFAEIFEDTEDDEEEIKRSDKEENFVNVQGFRLPNQDIYLSKDLIPAINKFTNKNKGKFLFSDCNNKAQRKKLRYLMKKANSFKEENAINVLYLSLGYLEWFENKDSVISHKAPLLFISAELSQDSFDSPFKITFPEGDFLLNDALIRKVGQEFNLNLSYDIIQNEKTLFEILVEYKKYILEECPDKRWKIHEEMDLGIFSFSKINMVSDLEENTEKISQHPIVKNLVGINNEIKQSFLLDEETIDEVVNAKEYYHVLDADSSQETAIQSAISGLNFVLEGPPGTGKSQTITNIITELIARNKKVLFVAEKKAALDVVYNNLKKIGLNDYALPIHNSKLNKKVVISELAATLENGQRKIDIDENFSDQHFRRFEDAKLKIVEYYNTLIKKRSPIEENLYQLYSNFIKYSQYKNVEFSITDIREIDDAKLLVFEAKIEQLFISYKSIGFSIGTHPWKGIKEDRFSLIYKENLLAIINEIIVGISNIESISEKIRDFSISKSSYFTDLTKFKDLLNHLLFIKRINIDIIDDNRLEDDIIAYEELIKIQNQLFETKNFICKEFDLSIIKTNSNEYFKITKSKSSFLKRIFSKQYKTIKNEVSCYYTSKKKKKIKYNSLLQMLDKINKYKILVKKQEYFKKALNYKTIVLENQQITENLHDLKWYQKFLIFVKDSSINISDDIIIALTNFISDRENNEIVIKAFITKFNEIQDLANDLQNHFDTSSTDFFQMSYDKLMNVFSDYIYKSETIESYINFNFSLNDASRNGLKDFCDEIIKNRINKNFYEIFLRRFYTLLIDSYLNEFLPGFSGYSLDLARESYIKTDKVIQSMAKIYVEKNILSNIPNFNGIEGYNVEVSLLRAEANKSRRILPFRILFNKIPNLILKLKPCLMMSPLSVSTFLRDTDIVFDTVIFDEASQVKPENAIGSLFRAQQVIIAGDKEQLPPTNFFQNIEEDENTEEENYDTLAFDSILEVSKSYITSVKLRWHYRSKFEELITPSNNEIYNNLVTFPSRKEPKEFEGIKFVYIDGLYAERINKIEGDKVVEVLKKIIDKYKISKSVGIVTFNKEQQSLIERKINHFRRKNPLYEFFFTDNENEPFFVKNIETVQGDERDLIIMSVGYGPDINGKVSMNFGPLNQVNGYRRLNVAITRAKVGLILISSIKANNIDLNRTESRGVAFLKKYLEYAESIKSISIDFEEEINDFSPLEEDIYKELSKAGYKVKKRLGLSSYKIDLAVANSNNPSNYLLGIECDGSIYNSSKSIRDRERIRKQVLENRDWVIYRIWSTDWIKNRKTQIDKLLDFIKSIDPNDEGKFKEESVIIPVINIEKEPIEIPFEIYPNYDELTKISYNTYYETEIPWFILDVIKKTSPIHETELKKIVPSFWGRQKYTSVVDRLLKPILTSLQLKGHILKQDEFYFI